LSWIRFFLPRFDGDLSRGVDCLLFKHNNLRFDERAYFQRVLALLKNMSKMIIKEHEWMDKDTITGVTAQ